MNERKTCSTGVDVQFLRRAIAIALESERRGNPPVGAVIVLGESIISEGASSIITPHYDPGRHAEIEALRRVPGELWHRSREMTCYTTLEPCLMCFGALLLHAIGRIVFGAEDKLGGAKAILNHLPEYYSDRSATPADRASLPANRANVPEWIGPLMSEECDALYDRVKTQFDLLPCGRAYLPAETEDL